MQFTSPEVFEEGDIPQGARHLGDIVISPGYVYRQCIRDKVRQPLQYAIISKYNIHTYMYTVM